MAWENNYTAYGTDTKTYRILEIQPTVNFEDFFGCANGNNKNWYNSWLNSYEYLLHRNNVWNWNYQEWTNQFRNLLNIQYYWFEHTYYNWKDFLRSYVFSDYEEELNVEVTKMTLAEFNGRTEDLGTNYDLIYMGCKSSVDYRSDYRFYHMGGSDGGSTLLKNKVLETIDQKTAMSGNDITAAKRQDLIKFAEAGNTIIFSGHMFNLENIENQNKLDRNILLDENSNMYAMVMQEKSTGGFEFKYIKNHGKGGKVKSEYENVILGNLWDYSWTDSINSGYDMVYSLKNCLKSKEEKLNLRLDEKPTSGAIEGPEGYLNSQNDPNNRELKYVFSINDSLNTTNAKYKVDLLMDLNSDGRYNEKTENMNRNVKLTLAGKAVDLNALEKGKPYQLTRDTGDYVGVIYWKLKVSRVDNSSIAWETMDYCKIKPYITGADGRPVEIKRELKVLQIMADEGNGTGNLGNNNVWLPSKEECLYLENTYRSFISQVENGSMTVDSIISQIAWLEASNTNEHFRLQERNQKISEEYLKVTLKFWYYTRNLDDFDLNIQRMVHSDYEQKAKNGTINLDNYDMLIVGFADCYTDFKETKALEAIKDFIRNGKTILFTHDTTSFVTKNSKIQGSGETDWGRNINAYFRNMVGLDRYGWTISGAPANSSLPVDGKDYVSSHMEKYNQGFTDTTVNNFKLLDSGQIPRTSTISRVNSGQITQYPYNLENVEVSDNRYEIMPVHEKRQLKVASTHGQYYQLDLETKDMVVWYTLDFDSGNNKTDKYGNSYRYAADSNEAWFSYGVYPRDVRNNYYIYNRGNITYSGAGHSGKLTDNEVKLFVNTMVSAYRAASAAITMDIINTDASSNKKGDCFLYVNFMPTDLKKPLGSNMVKVKNGKPNASGTLHKKIEFTLAKNTVASSEQMTMDFEVAKNVADSSSSSTETTIVKWPIYQLDNNSLVSDTNPLKNNMKYYFYAPLTQLEKQEKILIKCRVNLKYSDDVSGEMTKTVEKEITLMRRLMFNLN